jgi:hypothetical protein
VGSPRIKVKDKRLMPPSPVVHSIDVVLDRTDQTLLNESISGISSTFDHN